MAALITEKGDGAVSSPVGFSDPLPEVWTMLQTSLYASSRLEQRRYGAYFTTSALPVQDLLVANTC